MIPNSDYYADKFGKLTEDPNEYARQIAVKGCFLDDRVAKRFGITDVLVSISEPNAVRRVTGRNAASVQIITAADKEAQAPEPQEPADAVETAKPAAKKEKKK